MSHGALLYTARIAQTILSGSPISAFLFTNIGDPKQNSLDTVDGELARADLVKVCGDLVQAYLPKGVTPLPELLALDSAIPLYKPENSSVRHQAREILKITPDNLPSDMDFLSYIGTFSLP
jgi:hypothetical protein